MVNSEQEVRKVMSAMALQVLVLMVSRALFKTERSSWICCLREIGSAALESTTEGCLTWVICLTVAEGSADFLISYT